MLFSMKRDKERKGKEQRKRKTATLGLLLVSYEGCANDCEYSKCSEGEGISVLLWRNIQTRRVTDRERGRERGIKRERLREEERKG